MEYNKNIIRIGSICKRGHTFDGINNLRYIKDNKCVKCNSDSIKAINEKGKNGGWPKIDLKCYNCNSNFQCQKPCITRYKKKNGDIFCSNKCYSEYNNDNISVKNNNYSLAICPICKINFNILKSDLKRKWKMHFCSKSCRAKHMFKIGHFKCRSKLEEYLENNFNIYFPYLNILYNDRKLLDGLELDLYFLDYKIAIELNGIIHYQLVYGKTEKEKVKNLKHRQKKDKKKIKTCKKLGIELYCIDVSGKNDHKTPEKFLNQILDILNQRSIEILFKRLLE